MGLGDNSLEFEVSADGSSFKREMEDSASVAERSMEKVEKAVAGTEDSFGQAESAGKAMADAIIQKADDMKAEIDETKRAVDAMDAALEGAEDFDSREVVAELKQAGLTANEIEADADALARALREAGDVELHSARAGFDDLGQSVGDVREKTERAKGAVSSFAGGATSEMAGAAGAFGPMAEGAGQLVEGIAEGELGLKQLAGAAGAMGVAALAVKGITDQLAAAAELKAFKAEQIEAYDDALKDADSTLDGIVQKLTDAEGVTINLFGEGEQDITKQLLDAGLNMTDFAKLVEGGEDALEGWRTKAEEAGVSGDALKLVTVAVNTEIKALEESQKNAAVTAEFFNEKSDDLTGSFDRSAERAATLARATDDKAQADRDAEDAADEHADAVDGLGDSYADLKDELSDTKAYLNIQDSFDAVKKKGDEAFKAAAEGAEDADAKMRDYQRAQIDLTAEVINYSENVEAIPDDILTEIMTAIDQGNLEYVQGVMADLERDRTANLRVKLTQEGQIIFPNGQRAMDSGGSLATGETALVAERRPEVVNGQLVTEPTIVTGPATINAGSATNTQTSGSSGASASSGSRTPAPPTSPRGIRSTGGGSQRIVVVHMEAPRGFRPRSDAEIIDLIQREAEMERRSV